MGQAIRTSPVTQGICAYMKGSERCQLGRGGREVKAGARRRAGPEGADPARFPGSCAVGSVRRTPAVSDVRFVLLVAPTVVERDGGESVPLVEGPRGGVALEGVEVEPFRAALPG